MGRGPDKAQRYRRTKAEMYPGWQNKPQQTKYSVGVDIETILDLRDASELTGLPVKRLVINAVAHYLASPELAAVRRAGSPEPRPLADEAPRILDRGPWGQIGSHTWQGRTGIFRADPDVPVTLAEQLDLIQRAEAAGFDRLGNRPEPAADNFPPAP